MIKSEVTEFAKYDLAQLAAFLNETNIEKQAYAIDEAIRLNRLLAFSSVCALRDGQDRYFIAERLPRFGSIVVEPLKSLLEESREAEVKVLASLVLLRLGSRAGVPVLLDALLTEPAERYASLVARTLAANGIGEAGAVIIARLHGTDLSVTSVGKSFGSNPSKDMIVSLLAALKTLTITLPPDLQQRLEAPKLPVEIRSAL